MSIKISMPRSKATSKEVKDFIKECEPLYLPNKEVLIIVGKEDEGLLMEYQKQREIEIL